MTYRVRGIDYYLQESNPESALPNLIMLHGFMGSSASFDFLTTYLQDINIVRVDLLGHGKTGKGGDYDRFSSAEQLADLKQLVRQLSLESYFLYGYSMGGRLALRYALSNPSSLQGLILESTHEGIHNFQRRNKRKKTDWKWAERISQDYHSFLQWWQKLSLFESSAPLPEEKSQHYWKIQNSQDPEQMAMCLRGFGQGSVTPIDQTLESLRFPVLLGSGEYDEKYISRMKEMQQKMKDATHQIISKAGHRLHLDTPHTWAHHINEFINHFQNERD